MQETSDLSISSLDHSLMYTAKYKLKGWRHNRLMSNFWPFFYFCSDLPKFWYMSKRLIGKHLSYFFQWFSLFFLENNVCKKCYVS